MLIFDETGIEKKENSSVGVNRQYSGTLGKIGNCQVIVSCQYTDSRYSWLVTYRLYLPEKWTNGLRKAKVPGNIQFKTKIQIVLDLLDQAGQLGIPYCVGDGDSFYGGNPAFLEGFEQRSKNYAVSMPADFAVRFTQDINTFVPPVKPEGKKRGRPRTKP